ncbi:hypothetical protein QYE76_047390 [Lolium multiflorum]|uniref:Transposon protein, putative, CACTA, En/Spm sub-class n=1 Tax=Lolium multiflorum TaxID=4521 RepID=A0AAD8TRM0_LOLMU|nr:hypothetical protein QYE76_047390 [Lolium multiflorum]
MSSAASWREHIPRGVVAETRAASWRKQRKKAGRAQNFQPKFGSFAPVRGWNRCKRVLLLNCARPSFFPIRARRFGRRQAAKFLQALPPSPAARPHRRPPSAPSPAPARAVARPPSPPAPAARPRRALLLLFLLHTAPRRPAPLPLLRVFARAPPPALLLPCAVRRRTPSSLHTMPRPPRPGARIVLEEMQQMGEVRDWAPPGWHWEVLSSVARTLVRNPGPVVDPDILWWRSYGPRSFQREPAPPEEVAQRIEAEDQHVRRYMKLMVNFTFPEPADSDSDNKRPDPEDPELNSIQQRVKKWALKKMATQFNDYKKKLDNSFVKKKKTPDFKGPYEKIKDHWEAFVKYKTSERAKTRSDTNKKNAANKMYFHTMGRGGYKAGRPKWEKWENDLIKNGIQPEVRKWNQRSRDWFYAHGGTLDAQGFCIYTQRHRENPLPIEAFRNAAKEVEEGKFRPEREKDQLTRALGNPEHPGRTRTIPGGKPWCIGFPAETKKYPDRSRQRQKDVVQERVAKLEEQVRMIMSGSVTVTQPQPNPRIEEVAFDATGQGSQRKSSVASMELPGDDADVDPQMAPPSPVDPQMPSDLYPVDFIRVDTL